MLRLESTFLHYGAIEAIRDVSIAVDKGEVVTIIGGNGAGKTSLLKGIAGLERFSGGRVLLYGEDITHVAPHRRLKLGMAMSPEGRGVFSDQSVIDNLKLGGFSIKHDRAAITAGIAQAFDLFPRLRERQDQPAGTLSGGEQQMLAIARALMSNPQLLLLDEPSLGLAPLVIQEIFRTIRRLKSMGITILLVEQMANKALEVADRAYVLETGHVTLQGKGCDLLNNTQIQAAYLGVSQSGAH